MKKNVYKTLSAAMFAVVICFLCNLNAFAAIERDNCHDQASGEFSFKVEPKITLESSGDVDLGGICPGCCKEYDCCFNESQPHIFFTAHGAQNCMFSMDYHSAWDQPGTSGIYLPLGINYWTGTAWAPWEFGNEPVNFIPVPGQIGMGSMEWVVFICTKFCVDCETPAGQYSKTWYMSVEYACAD